MFYGWWFRVSNPLFTPPVRNAAWASELSFFADGHALCPSATCAHAHTHTRRTEATDRLESPPSNNSVRLWETTRNRSSPEISAIWCQTVGSLARACLRIGGSVMWLVVVRLLCEIHMKIRSSIIVWVYNRWKKPYAIRNWPIIVDLFSSHSTVIGQLISVLIDSWTQQLSTLRHLALLWETRQAKSDLCYR